MAVYQKSVSCVIFAYMTHVLLIRHGEDTDNAAGILNGHRDTELTDRGRTQAREAAQQLSQGTVDTIYTSPLKRTRSTADIVAEVVQAPIVEDKRLIERDFGVLTGKPLIEIRSYATEVLEGDQVLYFLSGPEIEEFPDVYDRVNSFLADIQHSHSNETVLVVTHGDTGKMLRAAYNGWHWRDALMKPFFANTETLRLS